MRYNFTCDICGCYGHVTCAMSEIDAYEQEGVVCPACGNLMRRVYNAPTVVYRGTGFTQAAHVKKEEKG